MPIKKLIARRTFVHEGKKHKEGSEVTFRKAEDLNNHIRRGLVVEKMFADPYGEEPVVQQAPEPERRKLGVSSQSQKLADRTFEKSSSVAGPEKKAD